MRLLLPCFVLTVLFSAACSSNESGGGGGTAGAAGAGGAAGAPPSCDVHAIEATPTFADTSVAWGLTGVVGNRLVAADLDGDDYPDLLVHAIGSNQRDPLDGGMPRLVRVLMNRENPGGGRHFVDATVESGYGTTRDGAAELRSAQLAVAGDLDNDGDLDLFSGTYTDSSKIQDPPTPADLDRSEILINDGSGHFSLGPPIEPHASWAFPTSGATWADVDRDGNLDLFVVGWYERYGLSAAGTQPRMHLGRGDGTFEEVAGLRGLAGDSSGFAQGTNNRPAYGTTSCDVDDDGDTDLLISAYGRQFNQLFVNDGAASFRDMGPQTGFAGDEDQTYDDNQFFLCACTVDPSDPACPANPQPVIGCPSPADSYWSPTDALPWRNNGNTFATACADVTGDGVMDLYNAEIRHFWAGEGSDASQLLVADLSGGSLAYTRPGQEASGMVWPHPTLDWNEGGLMAAIGDLDNDGRQDVVVAASDYPDQYSLVFHQQADGTFQEVGEAWGLHHPCASGLTMADFDRDGDLDVVVGSGTARDCSDHWSENEVHFYENDGRQSGTWLEVKLVGQSAVNAAAIGARISVTAGGLRQVREVGGGYGHFGMQNDLVTHFGLGACSEIDALEVRWPDQASSVTTHEGISVGGTATLSGPQ